MSSEEAKRIISEGLERRKAEQEEARKEARLEHYEREQIRICNKHCAGAKQLRQQQETGRLNRYLEEARNAAKA